MVPAEARLVRRPLEGRVSASEASLLVRGDRRPFALTGAWAGGGALVGAEPLVVAGPGDDPFELVDLQPRVEGDLGAGDPGAGDLGAVGGGWFGFFGYGLGARLERVPPPPPRPVPLPLFALAFYDHLLHLDGDGRWWFEALWTEERDAALRERYQRLSARLSGGVRESRVLVGAFEPAPPGGAGHLAAVEECRERIAAGEISQANLCLRLEGLWDGDPIDLFARATRARASRHAALLAGPWGAVCSLSPELFLRREGRRVRAEPIWGTAPRVERARADLAGSRKDRAENLMIVDLVRNDLGRVCEYGSIWKPGLIEPRPASGVWHLTSTVTGTLRPEVRDADLLRATFPPGSVTGAPKIQSMRVIAELEATAREAYTGAIGYVSPLAGLELNVAIRTLEVRGDRIWLAVGGGIGPDSVPAAELEECLIEARPVIAAAGGRLIVAERPAGSSSAARRASRRRAPALVLAGGADRPDPALGVFSTMLVREGVAANGSEHLARLRDSVRELYDQDLPPDLSERLQAAAAAHSSARLRVLAEPGGGGLAAVDIETRPLVGELEPCPVTLAAAELPGGLGRHKWRDRRLLAELERRLGAVPLLVDSNGDVLEAAAANVWLVEGESVVTPPLDGRLLPGTVRAELLARPPSGVDVREEPISLERLAVADEVLLTSSVRGVYPAGLVGGKVPCFRLGERLRAALDQAWAVSVPHTGTKTAHPPRVPARRG
jgi:para-aminobenzoate synthetase/4-amino-4-deoxychorismate lyase